MTVPDLDTLAAALRETSDEQGAQLLARLESDDIQAVLGQLPAEKAASVAAHLLDNQPRRIRDTHAAISGVEKSISELMTPAPAILPPESTAAEALAFLVKTKDIADITYIYVTDNQTLVGVVVMRDLILAKPAQTLADIMVAEPFAFALETPIREAISDVLSRHYPCYPVVDTDGTLVGIVRSWKLYERIAAEISGQAGAQVGVAREEQINTPVLSAFRMRHPWLQVNLLTAFAAAFVVGLFEDTITRIVALAVFLPVLAGQSGNTGCQAMAITLRGLTLGKLRDYPLRRLLRKEILLGALNGVLSGAVAGVAMTLYALATDATQPILLGLIILVAMTGACIGSGLFGVMVPLALKRLGADPATASSIFLTTFTDILGMGLMLLLATSLIS